MLVITHRYGWSVEATEHVVAARLVLRQTCRISAEHVPDDPTLRVPHVGWDDLHRVGACPLFDGLADDDLFYYVHSYAIHAADPAVVAGECDYGGRFVAAFRSGAVYGVQFHPEKSQKAGLAVLGNFVARG